MIPLPLPDCHRLDCTCPQECASSVRARRVVTTAEDAATCTGCEDVLPVGWIADLCPACLAIEDEEVAWSQDANGWWVCEVRP